MTKISITKLQEEIGKESVKELKGKVTHDYDCKESDGFFVGTTKMECDGCQSVETFYQYNLNKANTNDLLWLINQCDFEVVKVVKEDLPNIIFGKEELENAQDEIGEDVPYGVYMLKDCQGANYGGIEYEVFVQYGNTQKDLKEILYGLIERLHMYWNNYHIDFVD